jgi:hypothetical protein
MANEEKAEIRKGSRPPDDKTPTNPPSWRIVQKGDGFVFVEDENNPGSRHIAVSGGEKNVTIPGK